MRTYMSILLAVTLWLGCTPAQLKPLAAADAALRTACEMLAVAQAARMRVDAGPIIAATCNVESVTRTMRERLLAEQISAARAVGVHMDPITSEELEGAEPGEAPASPPEEAVAE
jgi:hypothetical protein